MFEYSGNIHIHSQYSDGSLSIPDIASIAGKCGLDFIIVTDHNNLQGLEKGEEGYSGNVLVLIGEEANDEKNHYLCLDIKKVVRENTENPQKVIDAVNAQDGIGIIAHPHEKGSPLFENGKTFEWLDWSVTNFQGMEIWNFTSQWRDGLLNLPAALFLLLYPHAAMQGPYRKTLQKLDQYQQQGKRIIATGGSDAHGIKKKLGLVSIEICSYETCFRCINMHILCSQSWNRETVHDRGLLYKAIKNGCCWVGYDYFKNSRGFQFVIKGRRKTWSMGETVPYQEGLQADIKTPYPAKVKLIRNGADYGESRGRKHVFKKLEPGVYRAEVYHWHLLRYRPWIFSNSIWISRA